MRMAFLLTISFFLLLSPFPKQTFAQENPGTYDCGLTGPSFCAVTANKCNSGFEPGTCNLGQCTTGLPCKKIEPPGGRGTWSCIPGLGSCTLVDDCAPGFYPGECPTPSFCGAGFTKPCLDNPPPPPGGVRNCTYRGGLGCEPATGTKGGGSCGECEEAVGCPSSGGSVSYCAAALYTCQPIPGCTPSQPGEAVIGYKPTYCNTKTGAIVDNPSPDDKNIGIKTALGCIPVRNTTDFIAWFLRWAIGIAGGIAFLLILFAGFQIITSSGDPERLKAGRELLTSAIAGLILIIFSVFLLRLIGVEILRIPGFGG